MNDWTGRIVYSPDVIVFVSWMHHMKRSDTFNHVNWNVHSLLEAKATPWLQINY